MIRVTKNFALQTKEYPKNFCNQIDLIFDQNSKSFVKFFYIENLLALVSFSKVSKPQIVLDDKQRYLMENS